MSKSSGALRGALVGYGFIGSKGHMPSYLERQDVEILAIADICLARRERARVECPQARIYDDLKNLLKHEAGNLDFVDIAVPPCDHAALTHLALDQGLHVLCEKPLTTSIVSAREMLLHAQKAKRVLFPCHNYKHAPVVKAIAEAIDSKKIGNVKSLTLSTYRNTHAKGVPEWKTHWRRQRSYSGGGIAMDHGSHTFYLTFDWLKSYPISVTAKMMNLYPDRYDTEDTFSAVMTFPNGLAQVHLTWTAGVRKVIYSVQGEAGAVTTWDDEFELAIIKKTEGPDVAQGAVTWETQRRCVASHWMDASHVQWFSSLWDQFKLAIGQNDFIGREAKEAYLCVQLIHKAYKSAALKCQEVSLDNDFSWLN